jgi:hypothetical protein
LRPLNCIIFRFENVPLIFTEYYLEDAELNLEKVDACIEQAKRESDPIAV